MTDDQEKAGTQLPADPSSVEPDLVAMGLEDVELTEEEQVALAAASARPVRKAVAEAEPTTKGRATPKRRQTAPTQERKRTTPAQFVRESIAELKKVVWPTLNQLQQYFVVVLVFVLIMIAIVSLLDLGFGTLILKIFG